MNWKRSYFSHALWLLYVLTVGCGTMEAIRAFAARHGVTGNVIYAIFVGVLLLEGLLCVLAWMGRKRFLPQRQGKNHGWKIAETILFLGLLGTGICLRIQELPGAAAGELYEMATMKYGQQVPRLLHGTENVYLLLLHGICFLLGNVPKYCIRFQLVLSVLAGIALYFGVRRLSGSFAALGLAAFYFLDPFMVSRSAVLSAESLFLLFYGIGLFAVAGALARRSGWVLEYIVAGILIGCVGYMDAFGWTLMLFALSIWYVVRKEAEAKCHQKPVVLLILTCCSAVTFLGCFLVDALSTGKAFGMVMHAWTGMYLPSGNVDPNLMQGLVGVFDGSLCSLLLFVFLTVGIFGYFMQERRERISVWMLSVAGILLCLFFGMRSDAVNPGILVIVSFYALAGIAVCEVFGPMAAAPEQTPLRYAEEIAQKYGRQSRTANEMMEEKGMQWTDAGIADDGCGMQEQAWKERAGEKGMQENETKDKMDAKVTQNAGAGDEAWNMAPQTRPKDGTEDKEEKPERTMLHNPLPLPKKKVTTIMDYDYEVAEDDDYDID